MRYSKFSHGDKNKNETSSPTELKTAVDFPSIFSIFHVVEEILKMESYGGTSEGSCKLEIA